MAEKLLIRCGESSVETVEWLCVDRPESQPITGSWQDLAAVAQDKLLVLLLPAAAALLMEIELPVKTNAQIKKALPFALEDLLAEDVESYHLVWLKQADDKLAVVAVAHQKIAAWLALFQSSGLELDGIYPETLCIPYQSESCSLVIEAGQAILRTGQWRGGAIDKNFLPLLLEKMINEGLECRELQLWARQPLAEWLKVLPFKSIKESVDPILPVLASGFAVLPTELNLLSGVYARQHKTNQRWQQWLPAFLILLTALAIQSAALLNHYWQQQAELSALEMQTQGLFKQTFPDVKRIVNVKVQADQQLAELKKQASFTGSSFMRLLYQFGLAMKDTPELRLKKLNFVNSSLQVQLSANDLGQLDQFKQQLQASLQVKIQSADSGITGVEAQLEIREK